MLTKTKMIKRTPDFKYTSWKPVLRTDFLWTCWGLNRIEHHLEVMDPHFPVFTIVNPSPQSFFINLLPHSVAHYINTSGSFPALPYFLAVIIIGQFPIYHNTNPVPEKICQFVPLWSMKHKIVFTSKGNLHMIPILWNKPEWCQDPTVNSLWKIPNHSVKTWSKVVSTTGQTNIEI
jgi:hypothetical protein